MQQDVEANQKHCGSGLTMMLPVETKKCHLFFDVFGTFLNEKNLRVHSMNGTPLNLTIHCMVNNDGYLCMVNNDGYLWMVNNNGYLH